MKNYKEKSFQWVGNIGDEHIRFYSAAIEGNREFFYQDDSPNFIVEYEVIKPQSDLFLELGVWNMKHQLLAHARTFDDVENNDKFSVVGKHRLTFSLDAGLFHEGDYLLKLNGFIFNKKKITQDEIILKFPVYVQKKNTRFGHALNQEGVLLGNKWKWHNSIKIEKS